jgi:hypothetical protein
MVERFLQLESFDFYRTFVSNTLLQSVSIDVESLSPENLSKYSLIMDTCRKIHAILDNVSVEEHPLSAGAPRPLRDAAG